MEEREFYLMIAWFGIIGITSLVAAIVFCNNTTIRLLIITGCLLLLAAFILPFIFNEGE